MNRSSASNRGYGLIPALGLLTVLSFFSWGFAEAVHSATSGPAYAIPKSRAHAAMLALDTTKVIGIEQCSACHDKEVTAWNSSHHHGSLDALAKGAGIATKMGVAKTYRES